MKYFAGGNFALQIDEVTYKARWVDADYVPHNWQQLQMEVVDRIVAGSLNKFKVTENQFNAIVILWGAKFDE
jgi:hypothetical protein